jgi:hypothetical protein
VKKYFFSGKRLFADPKHHSVVHKWNRQSKKVQMDSNQSDIQQQSENCKTHLLSQTLGDGNLITSVETLKIMKITLFTIYIELQFILQFKFKFLENKFVEWFLMQFSVNFQILNCDVILSKN